MKDDDNDHDDDDEDVDVDVDVDIDVDVDVDVNGDSDDDDGEENGSFNCNAQRKVITKKAAAMIRQRRWSCRPLGLCYCI